MLFDHDQLSKIPHVLTPEEVRAENYLSIPSLLIPAIGEDNQEGLAQQFDRAIGTRLFVSGQIDFDDYLDILHYTGVNVGNVVDYWENGISLSPSFLRS